LTRRYSTRNKSQKETLFSNLRKWEERKETWSSLGKKERVSIGKRLPALLTWKVNDVEKKKSKVQKRTLAADGREEW